MFVGRKNELKLLRDLYKSNRCELVVLYGRRRIGKSSLIDKFLENISDFIKFEAVEGDNTRVQITHYTEQLKEQIKDPLLISMKFNSWENAFTFLTERVIKKGQKRGKLVLFFDELQWMAAGRSRLVSILKYFWDNQWKTHNIMLILCGSIASFMIKKVIWSKALYGRITAHILLKGLAPREVSRMFQKKKCKEEILKYILIFGGVPKYLEEVNKNQSFNQNLNRLCFNKNGIMVTEIEKIFYNQFREVKTYLSIVIVLGTGMRTFGEISSTLNIATGGGLKQYIDNLEKAEIIRSFVPFDRGLKSKLKKYALSDEYLIFYFKYIKPNMQTILEGISNRLFEKLTKDSFNTWLGFAFERFCIKNAGFLSDIMGFKDEVLLASPYYEKKDNRFQIDLLFKRADNIITVCECKYHKKPIGTKIIPEMERKCSLFKTPRGYSLEKALISLYGPDESLKNTGYFNHYITLDDLL